MDSEDKMNFIKARRGNNKDGLIDFCEYIKSQFNTRELTILEIGAYLGESACIFADYFKSVTSIDCWTSEKCLSQSYNMAEVEAEYDRNISKFDNIIKVKGFSEDVVTQFQDKSFDIVYIDGSHDAENVRKDLINYLLKSKIFISGHDYGSEKNNNEYQGLIDAVNNIVGKPDKIFQDFSWIKKIGG
jgi:hypothetical protein